MISSTWRYDPAGLFSAKRWGIPFIDVVPDMPDKPRGDEIFAWLKTRKNVHRFAVLDDQDDEGPRVIFRLIPVGLRPTVAGWRHSRD